jgi:two-component system nitrogen regulation response regulator NtrX
MRKGKFDQAHDATIFLDEIGDMSLKAQSKTLRILQEQKFERVGGTRTINVNVRVLAATNKDLEEEIDKSRFREDLYYRLNVIPVRVPPLRERAEDVPELVREFVEEFTFKTNLEPKTFTEDSIRTLQKYEWPGNVRELKNLVERLMIMTPANRITASEIPHPFNRSAESTGDADSALMLDSLKAAKRAFEKAYIQNKLQEFDGNISQTAQAIGIERSNLHKKIKTHGLEGFKS